MKDYRLSEIKNHDWNELWGISGEDIAQRRLQFEFLRKTQYALERLDIEPRDMIELPCKEHRINDYGKDRWDVYYRDEKYGFVRHEIFGSEANADAFLAELKGDKE